MDKSNSKILGNHLRDLRKEKKITQRQLAATTHIAASTICAYEKGTRRIEALNFFAICRALRTSPEEIEKFIEENISNN